MFSVGKNIISSQKNILSNKTLEVCSSMRDSSFEFLRLLAMFFIIFGHCMLSTAVNDQNIMSTLDLSGMGVMALTACAVNCFFLISGYFFKSSSLNLNRVLIIWFKTVFYSVFLYLIVSLLFFNFSCKELLSYCFPVFTKKYWFIQTYIALALTMPFILSGIEKLSNGKLTFLVIVLVMFFSCHETFMKVKFTLDQTQGYGFMSGMMYYIIGFWIRKNSSLFCAIPKTGYIGLYLTVSLLIFLSGYLIVRFNIAGGVVSRANFYAYNSITVLVQSISLFCFFVKISRLNLKYRSINYLSKNVLAGYLISSHPMLLFSIWKINCLYHIATDISVAAFIILTLILTLCVLVLCILADKVLDKIIKLFHVNLVMQQIDNTVNSFLKVK